MNTSLSDIESPAGLAELLVAEPQHGLGHVCLDAVERPQGLRLDLVLHQPPRVDGRLLGQGGLRLLGLPPLPVGLHVLLDRQLLQGLPHPTPQRVPALLSVLTALLLRLAILVFLPRTVRVAVLGGEVPHHVLDHLQHLVHQFGLVSQLHLAGEHGALQVGLERQAAPHHRHDGHLALRVAGLLQQPDRLGRHPLRPREERHQAVLEHPIQAECDRPLLLLPLLTAAIDGVRQLLANETDERRHLDVLLGAVGVLVLLLLDPGRLRVFDNRLRNYCYLVFVDLSQGSGYSCFNRVIFGGRRSPLLQVLHELFHLRLPRDGVVVGIPPRRPTVVPVAPRLLKVGLAPDRRPRRGPRVPGAPTGPARRRGPAAVVS